MKFPLLKRVSSSLSDIDDSEPTDASKCSIPPPKKRARSDTGPQVTKQYIPHIMPTTFREFLPSRSDADALIAACFEALMAVPLEKSSFQSAYEATFARKDDQIRPEHDTDWLCCLASVFLLGTQSLKRNDPKKYNRLQQRYMRYIWRNFRALITTPKLLNIQALVRLAIYDLSTGKRNDTLILMGIAARQVCRNHQPYFNTFSKSVLTQAISIGLHREDLNAGFSAMEQSARKSTWWYIHTIEKGLSSILGRPSCIPSREVSISYSDEALTDQGPVRYPQSTEAFATEYSRGLAS